MELMFCSQCRAQIDEDSKFCRLCGNPTSPLVTKPSTPATVDRKFQLKYLGLLIGIIVAPVIGSGVASAESWSGGFSLGVFLMVPCGLVGFAIGAVIDQLRK